MVSLLYQRTLMAVSPSEVAACANLRLGQVSPGTEECQFTSTAYSLASFESTGTSASGKHFMISAAPGSTGAGTRRILSRSAERYSTMRVNRLFVCGDEPSILSR